MSYLGIRVGLLLVILQMTVSKSAKNNARPVYEVGNEQARIDENKQTNTPGVLPYGNPLAGNSLQNAKLHAQNQQAMFNAEKVRQHRAQLQRLAQGNQQTDSYMRAYHELQEKHQLALEQQQASLEEKKITTPRNKQRQESTKRVKNPEVTKLTKEDAVVKTERNRNHRSHGSVEYQQYLQSDSQPIRYKTVYVTPGSTYNEGVAIKPNGVSYLDDRGPSILHTEDLTSKTQYIYPKQHTQMQSYESAQDIEVLNALLKKAPQQQLSELNAMIESDKRAINNPDTPIDLYFYIKDHNTNQNNDDSLYTEIPQTYSNGYTQEPEIKDHTPISEELDDIEDPNKYTTFKSNGVQTVITTNMPDGDSSTRSNYFNVASQTVEPTVAYVSDKPTFQALKYEPSYSIQNIKNDGDASERYLHHNLQHEGVQHLNEDGEGVSAYGDDNLQYAANYEFGYRVRDHHTGNDFGHREAKRDGKTSGQYHVLLPDGRMQQVKYSAGPGGFHADITYDHIH